MEISGTTRILGIIGDPVAHSRSPLMQNRALAAMGLDYVYVPFRVAPERLAEAVAGLRAAGVKGFNVTVPHKVAVVPFLDGLSPEAEQIGAVNTVHNVDGRLVGYNTDGTGLVRSLREDLDFDPSGTAIIVLGAGGAAWAAVHAFCTAGADRIVVVNRTMATANALVETYGKLFPGVRLVAREVVPATLADMDILINTTSVGMDGVSLAAYPATLGEDSVVYDMIYAPPETPLLAAARRCGLRCVNGLGMLAAQGEVAFTIWTGMVPPSGLMKAVLGEQSSEL